MNSLSLRNPYRRCKLTVCLAGGVAATVRLIGGGPHLAVTGPAVAALLLMVQDCGECATAAVSAGALPLSMDLLTQTADPALLEATLVVRL